MSAPTASDQILRRTLELSVPLHPSIRHLDEATADYQLGGPPGVALFRQEDEARISHVSGSPDVALAEVLDELHTRHLELAGLTPGTDNSHVLALVLLCLYLADEDQAERLGLVALSRRPASVDAVDQEAGRHDPEVAVGDAVFRAWTPVHAAHVGDDAVHQAVLQFHFHARPRHERYAPW